MNDSQLEALLSEVAGGSMTIDAALNRLRALPFETLEGVATLDHHRLLRTGFPEVIYCEGKTAEQVALISERLAAQSPRLLGTRATEAQFEAASRKVPDLAWHEQRALSLVGSRTRFRAEVRCHGRLRRHQRSARP